MSDEVESFQQRFTEFLKTFKHPEGGFKYEDGIKQMIVERRKSITVDYEDLVKFDVKLFELLAEKPEEGFYAFSEAIRDIVREFDEEYASSVSRFVPRLSGLPITTTLRELSNEHINKLVMIEGILVRATPPKQKMYRATYAHILPTGEVHEFEWPPLPSDEIGDEFERPAYCPLCKEDIIGEKGRGFGRGVFRLIVEKSKYRNWQKVVLQERPEEVPAGHIPRSIEIVLTDDIVDIARPGDRVSIIGIVKLLKESRRKGVQPIFNTYIEANNIIVAQRFLEEVKLGKEDEELIKKLSRDPLIRRKIICSIAPSIYGLWDIKESIALQLFGGVPKVAPDGTKVRGDIHILIVGDPGTAKSLAHNEVVMYVDSNGLLHVTTIGQLVDDYLKRFKENVRYEGESEVLYMRDVGEEIYTISINPITLKTEVKPIKALIRHRAPDKMLIVKTELGRQVVVTQDHSLIGYDGRKIAPITPHEALGKKLLIPILRRLNRIKVLERIEVRDRDIELSYELGFIVGITLRYKPHIDRYDRVSIKVGNKLASNLVSIIDSLNNNKLGVEYEVRDSEVVLKGGLLTETLDKLYNNPSLLINASENFIIGFLKGFMFEELSNTSSRDSKIRISLNHDNKILATAVPTSLLILGVPFKISIYRTDIELEVSLDNLKNIDVVKGLRTDEEVMWDVVTDVEIRELKEITPESEYVYDLSIDFNENFVAGICPIFVHNSQILQYVARIAPRGLYTTGKGSSAAGLCVSGDTLLYTSNGLIPIKELVERNLNNLKICNGMLISLNPKPIEVVSYRDGVVEYSRASQYYKLWSDKLSVIKTSLGLDLITTPETKVLIYDGNDVVWREASKLRKGDYVVVVRKLPESERVVNILEVLPYNTYLKIDKELVNTTISTLKTKYRSLSNFLNTKLVSKYRFYKLLKEGIIRLRELKYLAELLGIDSNSLSTHINEIGYRGFRGINWVKLPAVNDEFIKFLSQIFPRISIVIDKHHRPTMIRYHVNSDIDIDYFINNLKRLFIPPNLSLNYKVCKRRYRRYVLVRNNTLSLLLSVWGIPYNVNELTSKLIFNLPKNYLALFIKELIVSSGYVGRRHAYILLATRTSAVLLNMMLRKFGVLSSIHESSSRFKVVINDQRSFRTLLKDFLGYEGVLSDYRFRKPKNGCNDYLEINEELTAVRITDVIDGPGEYVYDLTIDNTHSFIANGFIVHNTAAVIKEKQSGEYFLEAGAMVLADGGTVCIDEIDKMRDEDRVAIHEAMEQGTVSIAKAGIVARLNARASVLAAGNPKYGRYIPSRPIAENINLPITILSRFDLIFTLRDLTDIERDKSLVKHVLRTHETIEEVRPEIPPEILRKYIAYAKKYVRPRLTKDAELLIEEFYLEMRRKSAEVPEAPIAITTRQLEALIRLAEAHARMALKNYVDAEDAAEAIRLMNVMLENVGIDVETGHIDIDVIMTGKPKSIRDKELVIKDIIKELSTEAGCAKIKDILKESVKRGIDEDFVEKYITSLRRAGELYEVRAGCINFVE